MLPDRVSNPGPLTYVKKRKEKRKYVARPGIEPRTPDLRVRCPTDALRGPARAIGPCGGCYDICFFLTYLVFFSLSLGDGSIETEILSQRVVKPID